MKCAQLCEGRFQVFDRLWSQWSGLFKFYSDDWINRCTRQCYRCVQHLSVLPTIHHRSRS